MECPVCGKRLYVIDSRMHGKYKRIRRYRCHKCGFEEITGEEMPKQKQNISYM
jgi:transcriptional regulator NrdR family protein